MEPEQKFYKFYPERLLPPGQYLVMYPEKSYMILFEEEGLIEIMRPSDMEFAQIFVLLRNYPYHAPFEELLAAYTWGGEITEKKRIRARKILSDAMDCGEYDQVMRPLRNLLSRCQLKIRPLGIQVSCMLEVGYILTPFVSRVQLAASRE